MKILLVNPYQIHLINKSGKIYNRVWPPLALANCAALLEREGHKVEVLDANALRLGPEEVARRSQGWDRVFLSSSSLDRWQCPNLDMGPFLETAAAVRRKTDEVFVLGAHGTVRPAEVLERTEARAVIRGEPERTVLEICRGADLGEIAGLAFREDGTLRVTGDPVPLDLKELPIPAFHLLPMDRYHYEVLGPRFTLFEASRGCAARCRFCLLAMYGKGVRKKPLEKLIAEIADAVPRFGIRTAYFMDLEFTVFRRQVMELCTYLERQPFRLQWTCQTRFDLVDRELLDRMKRAGCRLIHFGVEAGTDELLQRIGKKITVAQIQEGMRLVQEAGIESACFFMLGFPGSDQGEIRKTVEFAYRLNPTYALFHLAIPYPGTPLYADLFGEEGVPEEGLFPEACRNGLELEALKRSARKAYLGFYVRPRYILSRLSKGDLGSLYRQVKLFWGYL